MGWDGMGRDWMVLFCNQKWNRSRKRSDTHPSEIERYETRPGVPGWRSCKLRKADRVGSRWISWGDGWTWVSFCWHLVISQWFGWCISRQRMECEYDCEKNTHKILDVFVTLTWAYTNKETTPKSKSKPTTPTPTPTPPTPLLSLALYIHFHWLSYSFLKVLERLAFRKRIPTTGSWHNATCWKRVVCSTQKSIFSIRRTFSWVFLAFFCFVFFCFVLPFWPLSWVCLGLYLILSVGVPSQMHCCSFQHIHSIDYCSYVFYRQELLGVSTEFTRRRVLRPLWWLNDCCFYI